MINKNGFSLIELCIVLIIIGLLLGPLLAFINLYFKERARRITHENLATMSVALGEYYNEYGHFPCPASLSAKSVYPEFGQSTECSNHSGESSTTSSSSNYKTASACPNGVCTAYGRNGDAIKIGAIPHKVLGLPFQSALDGYSNRISYAVTERYATPQVLKHLGAISIENANAETLVNPKGSAQFILVSHGRDGKGSYSADGVLNNIECSEDNGADYENCDLDDIFLDGDYAEVDGKHHYDDIVLYKMYGNHLLWQTSPMDENNIYNATLGNVGIGTETPEYKLDVNGNLRVLGNVNTTNICNEEGEDCFEHSIIGGNGIICTENNQTMIGIKNSEPICEDVTIKEMPNTVCEEGTYVVGFTLLGGIICELPEWDVKDGNNLKATVN